VVTIKREKKGSYHVMQDGKHVATIWDIGLRYPCWILFNRQGLDLQLHSFKAAKAKAKEIFS